MKPLETLPPNYKFEDRVVRINGNEYTARGKSWSRGKISPQQQELYPGVFQGSLPWNNKKVKVYKAAKALLGSEDHSEVNAGNWKAVLTDFAYPATLAPYAPEDNTPIRQQYGLRHVTKEDRENFYRLVDLIINHSELQKVAHKDSSSSGAPFFIRGKSYKKDCVLHYYSMDNFVKFRDAIGSNDPEQMTQWQVLPIYTQGTRKHAVSVDLNANSASTTKVREYQTWRQIIEDRNERTKVDFTHPVDSRLVTYDIRSMYAAPMHANFANQVVNNALMAGFKKVADVVDYKGEVALSDQIKSFIRKNELKGKAVKIISLDKRKFGETFAPELIKFLLDKLWESPFRPLMPIVDNMINWATYYRAVERDNPRHILTRDFTSIMPPHLKYRAAFKSGNGLVALLGKLLGTFDAWNIAKSTFEDLNLETFLKNEDERVLVKNSGDDTLFCFQEEYFQRFQAGLKSSLHADEIEDLALFLGYYYTQSGDVVVDAGKFLLHMNCFERGFNSKSAPRAGLRARMEIYSSNPYFQEVLQIEKDALLECCNFDLTKYLETADPLSDKLLALVKNPFDYVFIDNPDLIYYKDGMLENISEELVASFYSYTYPEEYEHILKFS